MSDIRIDDDGFLVGDTEQQRTEAESVLMREIKTDTTTIIGLMKGTQRLQRDALKAAQSAAKNKGNQSNDGNSGNMPPRVNLQHPNRANGANNQGQRVNLQHPNRPPINNGNGANGGQQRDTARPRVQQNQGGNAGSPTPQSQSNGSSDTARVNRQRDANGRFIGGDNADIGSESEAAQRRGNRDSRGRFTGGDGSAAERSAVSRITDSLKDLNSNLTLNADTDRIDPMVDAIKEASGIVAVGIDASKKVLSVGSTLIAKPAMALGRGIKGLFKPKTDTINSPVAWYKRIWRTLVQGNRQDQTQHAQEQRRLDELVRGQGQRGSADSGLLLMLGLGLAGLLAAFKNIKIPSIDDIKNAIIGASESIKEQAKKSINDLGYNNDSPISPMSIKPPALRPPQTQPSLLSKAFDWAKDTKVGKVAGWGVRKLPYIGSALETGAGGVNAYNIDQDQTLTPQQKMLKQAENAGRTGGRIGGGLAGATAGGATALSLTAPTMNPFIIVPSVIGGSILGGIYGADAGGYLGEKAGGGIYKNIANTPTQRSKKFIEPSAYADRDSEARKLYEEHKRLDVDGNGIITRDEMIKGGRRDLLGEPDAPKTKKVPSSTQADYNKNSEIINDAAARFNVDPKKLTAFAYAESRFKGGDIKAPTTTATGMLQFVEDTWAWQIAKSQQPEAQPYKKDAQAYLADKKNRMPRTQRREKYKHLLDARADNKLNTIMGAQYSRDALSDFEKKGVNNPSMAEIYAYHHDGNPQRVIAARNGDKSALAQLAEWDEILNKGAAYATNTQVSTIAPKAITTPTANMATNSVPTMKAAPVTASPVPNVQSVQSVQAKEQPTRHNTTPTPIKVSFAKPLAGQNVSDRGIAHILTGGIGETV